MNRFIIILPILFTGGFLYPSFRLRTPNDIPSTITTILTPSKIDLGKKETKELNLKLQKPKWKTDTNILNIVNPSYPNCLKNYTIKLT